MAAWLAAQRLNPEHASEDRSHARNVLAGNALQFLVTANAAVRVEKIVQRLDTRTEALFTYAAAPRQNSRKTIEVVPYRPALRAPNIC
jgi:hypothetical protein